MRSIFEIMLSTACNARCAYCHNPDTWNPAGGQEITVEEVVRRAKRGRPYYGANGGVTFSGGEPLLQGEFVLEAVRALKREGISSAIDTSGTYFDDMSEKVIDAADMLLLDIKHIDPKKFRELTGREQSPLFRLIEVINRLDKPIWIRQVIVPGFNDDEQYIYSLNEFLRKIRSVKKIELLGYHNMAENKYDRMGLRYRLQGVRPMNRNRLQQLSSLTQIV